MSALRSVLERARQKRLDDEWYVAEHPYALEIRTSEEPVGSAYFVFPLGPSGLSCKRRFRSTVEATLGGVVAEEHGYAWFDLDIRGNFGLSPKFGEDTTFRVDPSLQIDKGLPLSGPLWTIRMLRNFFDRYARLKSDPEYAHETVLIWHDLKIGESYVIVPEEVDLDRSNDKRMLFPFTIRAKAVAKAAAIVPSRTILRNAATSLVQTIRRPLTIVRQALAIGQAALDEATRFTGELRRDIAQVDGLLSDVSNILDSATAFADGATDVLTIGDQLLRSTSTVLDSTLALLGSDRPAPRGPRHLPADAGLRDVHPGAAAALPARLLRRDRLVRGERRSVAGASEDDISAAASNDTKQTLDSWDRASVVATLRCRRWRCSDASGEPPLPRLPAAHGAGHGLAGVAGAAVPGRRRSGAGHRDAEPAEAAVHLADGRAGASRRRATRWRSPRSR